MVNTRHGEQCMELVATLVGVQRLAACEAMQTRNCWDTTQVVLDGSCPLYIGSTQFSIEGRIHLQEIACKWN